MSRLLVAAALTLACAGTERGGFDAVLDGITTRYGVQPTSLPLVARAALALAAPAGASGLRLATFEKPSFGDPNELAALIKRRVGAGFRPLVQTISRKDGEATMIYAQPESDERIALLIFTSERDEATLVQVVVSPDQLTGVVKGKAFGIH